MGGGNYIEGCIMKQKYMVGDKVLLKTVFPESMSHFSGKGCEALIRVVYSDAHTDDEYTLIILNNPISKKPYSSSWYDNRTIECLLEKTCDKNILLLHKLRNV